jgi:glycosyltransferase involved in cell wall biosynthesis
MLTGLPDVSIVVPCRNHAAEVARCLQSLQDQQFDGLAEIIVVDAGMDDAVLAAAGAFPTVRVVRGRAPLLPGEARNLGAGSARAAVLCFIDADCVAEPGWLAAATRALRDGARLVGGPVLHGEPWHPVATIDNLMQFSDLAPGRPQGPAELLPSCNLAMSIADFVSLGGYPRVSLPAGEDVLFCRQAAARWGGSLHFVPAMRVRHYGRSTLRGLWIHQDAFGHARARLGLQVTATHGRLGRAAILVPLLGLRRIGYIVARAVQWHPLSLVALSLGFPVLVLGMTAWCRGFHRGCTIPLPRPQLDSTGDGT